jgi:tRNA-modifying protein YgfZ
MTGSVPPSPTPTLSPVVRLGPGEVTPQMIAAIRTGALVARPDVSALALSGSGAVSCIQGLLTNDVEQPGDGAFVYGAMLTPKGMIVVDGWVARRGTTVTFTTPAEGGARALAILSRSVPPRLAKTRDQSAEVAVLRLAGPRSFAIAEAAGLAPLPGAGRAAAVGDWEVARAAELAPFALQLTGPAAGTAELVRRLHAAGALEADPIALECARILAGWPRLGAEVDEKTIPQEVRFDELGGVSYTKGCYTGQETVSRLHFRGHVNRSLRGLLFDGEPADGPYGVTRLDQEAGRVTSLMWMPAAGRWIGLAMLRRDVAPGDMARAADCDVRVVALPFAL